MVCFFNLQHRAIRQNMTFEEHAKVYLEQMDSDIFSKTKYSKRLGHALSFADYVLTAHVKEDSRANPFA